MHSSAALKDSRANKGIGDYVLLRGYPEPDVEQMWRSLLERVENPAHYNSPEYFLEPYWTGQKPFALLLRASDKFTAVATGLDHGSEVVCGLQSRPQICVDKDVDFDGTCYVLAKALRDAFPSAKVVNLYAWRWTHLDRLLGSEYKSLPLEGDVVLDLRDGPDAIFESFRKNRRRDIRLAIRNGVEISEVSTDRDLEDYWTVYRVWQKTDRKVIHHHAELGKVEATLQLRNSHRRFLARHNGEAIAACGIRFYVNGLVEYSNNCSRDEFLNLCPNDLLLWRVIEWACANGYPALSLGGAHPFLKKWGGETEPIYRYRLDRTFGRRIERREAVMNKAHQLFHHMPAPMQSALRRLTHRA